jgi:hypothetical protein
MLPRNNERLTGSFCIRMIPPLKKKSYCIDPGYTGREQPGAIYLAVLFFIPFIQLDIGIFIRFIG